MRTSKIVWMALALCITFPAQSNDCRAQTWVPIAPTILHTNPAATRVGIGTTSPADLLDILSSTNLPAGIRFGLDECSLYGRLMVSRFNTFPGIAEHGDFLLKTNGASGCGNNLLLWAEHDDPVSNYGTIRILTGDEVLGPAVDESEKVSISSITTAPTYIHSVLDVKNRIDKAGNPVVRFYKSDAYTGANLQPTDTWTIGLDFADGNKFKIAHDDDPGLSSPAVTITQTGAVGIGTTTPTGRLNVHQSDFPMMKVSGPLGSAELAVAQGAGHWSALATPGDAVLRTEGVDAEDLIFATINNLKPGAIRFSTRELFGSEAERMIITSDGLVGIGTSTPQELLHVNVDGSNTRVRIGALGQATGLHTDAHLEVDGKIVTREVVVTVTDWADYVFEDDYELMPLEELEQHIITNKHLPEIPTAAEVAENGVSVNEMQVALLKKIEELTLYVIELQKDNKELRSIVESNRR